MKKFLKNLGEMKMVYLKKVKGHKGVYYHTGFKRYYKTEGLDFIAIKKPKKKVK